MHAESVEPWAFVTERIALYAAECPDNRYWLTPYVEKYQILPLLLQWFETTGITPDGSIRKFSTEDNLSPYEGLRKVEDAAGFFGALVQGARTYPQLSILIPERPRDAQTCEACGGVGVYPQRPEMVCECGGVGWNAAGDKPFDAGAAQAAVHRRMYAKRSWRLIRLFYTHALSIILLAALVMLDWTLALGLLHSPSSWIVAYAVALLIAFRIAPAAARLIR
jgi:hypothetical protein